MSASPNWSNWLPQASSAMRGAASYNPGGYGGALSSLGNYTGGAGNAAGVLSGLQQGGVGGYGSAGINAAQLAKRTGAFGSGSGAAGQGLGDAVNALGIYRGIKQGGVGGYGGAAVNAAELGSRVGALAPEVGQYAGYAALPLAAYNFMKNDTASGRTGSDALGGAETGAEAGAMFGPVGMGVGALVGGAAGALASAFGPGAVDPENKNFEGYTQAYNKALQQGGQKAADQVAASDTNPYLALAGYMDLRKGQMKGSNPIYDTYGRMGEQKFTNDLVSQLSTAQKSGQIKPGESTAQAYNDVVTPWVNKMGNWQDSNKQAMQGILEQMTAQDLSGQAGNDWKSIGGGSPFASLSPTTQAPTQANFPMARTGRGQMQAAEGGPVKHSELSAKLRRLYEGSFKDRTRHYDEGGGVSTYFGTGPSSYSSTPSYYTNAGAGAGTTTNFGSSDPFGSVATPNPDYTPSAGSSGAGGGGGAGSGGGGANSGSILGQGGALSGLGSLLGVSSMGQLVKQYGALAPLLSGLLGQNKPASAPATPAGYGAIPSIATPANNRSYTQPNVANWYTYGQGPEQSFFSNNQLPNVPGVSPSNAAPAAGSPTMGTQPITPHPGTQLPVMAGGGSFDSTQGDDYVSDPGHGDGTSDGIDAKLSGGEYVMDAGTVSTLGNGSNEAGARALDQLRTRVRKHAGKQLVKGKQFMKAKQPQAYLGGKG